VPAATAQNASQAAPQYGYPVAAANTPASSGTGATTNPIRSNGPSYPSTDVVRHDASGANRYASGQSSASTPTDRYNMASADTGASRYGATTTSQWSNATTSGALPPPSAASSGQGQDPSLSASVVGDRYASAAAGTTTSPSNAFNANSASSPYASSSAAPAAVTMAGNAGGFSSGNAAPSSALGTSMGQTTGAGQFTTPANTGSGASAFRPGGVSDYAPNTTGSPATGASPAPASPASGTAAANATGATTATYPTTTYPATNYSSFGGTQ
jgi:hypothetical protein